MQSCLTYHTLKYCIKLSLDLGVLNLGGLGNNKITKRGLEIYQIEARMLYSGVFGSDECCLIHSDLVGYLEFSLK
jgi:hypothetical protein